MKIRPLVWWLVAAQALVAAANAGWPGALAAQPDEDSAQASPPGEVDESPAGDALPADDPAADDPAADEVLQATDTPAGPPGAPKPKVRPDRPADSPDVDAPSPTAIGPAPAGDDPWARAPQALEQPPGADGAPMGEDEEREEPAVYTASAQSRPAGRGWLWVPRVLLFPAHVVTEYVLRVPLGWTATALEKYSVPARIRSFLTWDEGRGGIYPLGFLNLNGIGSSLGLTVFWNQFPISEMDLELAANADINRNYHSALNVTYRVPGRPLNVVVLMETSQRVSEAFFGVGPQRAESEDLRLSHRWAGGQVQLQRETTESGIAWNASVEVAWRELDCPAGAPSVCGEDGQTRTEDDPLTDLAGQGLSTLGQNCTTVEAGFQAFWDTRQPRPASSTGGTIGAQARVGQGVAGALSGTTWFEYGAEVTGFVDVYGDLQRTLGLRVRATLVDPVGDRELPYVELAQLGGLETMRGYFRGQFRGRSALTATMSYRYPVWTLADGELFYEVGNTFGAQFDGFAFDLLRGSFGFALRAWQTRLTSFDLRFAFGHTPYRDAFEVDSFRFSVGTNRGF